jgi:hypothetical protein
LTAFFAAVNGQFGMKAELRNGANASHLALAARTRSELLVHKNVACIEQMNVSDRGEGEINSERRPCLSVG